jgi:RNA polymerase sigma-70 factor, ECF subfamily
LNTPRPRSHESLVGEALAMDAQAGTQSLGAASARTAAPLDVEALFRRHGEFVLRMAQRMGAEDADDVLQEVFARACRKASSFGGRSAPQTWLVGICVRVVQEQRRKIGLRRRLADAARAVMPFAPAPRDPAAQAQGHEEQRLVHGILTRMARKKREVFVLYELEGLSGAEIADALGVSQGTVRSRLFHARRDFLRLLGREEASR